MRVCHLERNDHRSQHRHSAERERASLGDGSKEGLRPPPHRTLLCRGRERLAPRTSSDSATGLSNVTDYVSHHNGFAYNINTANPHHLPPTGPVGYTDQANHQYDLSLFLSAITDGNLPSVTFVKAKKFQNGHPGNSTPLDEQTWLVTAVNAIENSKYWDDTAIFITYDDSDGWYDHQMDTVVNQSSSANDDDLQRPRRLRNDSRRRRHPAAAVTGRACLCS